MSLPTNSTRHVSGPLNAEGLSEEYLQLEHALGERPFVCLEGTVHEQRQTMENNAIAHNKELLTPALEDIVTRDSTVTAEDGFGVPVRIYYRKTEAGAAPTGRPGVVYIHGGGWIHGSIVSDDLHCRKIALDANHIVISVQYRRAPEHVFPRAAQDSYAVFRWVHKNAASLGIDDTKLYVNGNSAGGNLAASVAIQAVQSDTPTALAAQVLRVPLTCHPKVFPGHKTPKSQVPIIDDDMVIAMIDSYVPVEADWKNPLLSPLLAPDEVLKKLPPAYIDVCTADPLYEGGVAYAKKLEDLGVPVKLFILDGMPHGSYIIFPALPSSEVAHKACVACAEWALNYRK